MKGVGEFFQKFNNSAVQEIQKRTIVSDLIYKFTKQKIPIESISFSNKVIKIIGQQGLKSEIYIKKKLILEGVCKELPNLKVTDIK